MAFDPTTITSAVIATPIAMVGNNIKTWITNWWHMDEHVEVGRRHLRLYTPLRGIVEDPVFERQLETLDHQLADSSDQSVGCLGFFRGSIRAQGIQDSLARLKESTRSHATVMTLLSRFSDRLPVLHRYSIPDVYLQTSDYAVGIENRLQRLESLLLDEAGPQLIGLFGMAGVGKSFLAALVCRRERVKQHFRDKILWVDVNNVRCQEEVLQLQMELFSVFTGQTMTRCFASDVEGRQALCDYLAALQDRYLLVYDNVWKRHIVEPLHFELNSSDRRTNTKTMVVSRKGDLLQGSRFNSSSVEVPPLSSEDAHRLFCKNAFHGNETVPEDVERYVKALVGRCSGIPMVLQVMAKYVSRDEQRMQQVGFWKYVLSEVGRAEAKSEDDYQKLLGMMKLSYEDLKEDVKQLFLVYATIREYYLFDDFYYRWLALQGGIEEDEVMMIKFERAFDALQTGFLVGVKRHHERCHELLPPLLIDLAHHIMAADKSLGFFWDRCPQSQEELKSAKLIRLISSGFKHFGESPICLESATHLKVMDLENDFVDFDILCECDLPSSLRFLSCEGNTNAEDWLSRLVELRFLKLEDVFDSGTDRMARVLMALRKLSKLEVLYLDIQTRVELDLSFLGCRPGLVILHIKAPPGSTVRNLHLAQLKRLKVLRIPITCTNLENRDWEHGDSLEIFDIGSWVSVHGCPRKEESRDADAQVDRLLGSFSGPCSKLEMLRFRDIRITKLSSEFNFPNLKLLELTVAMECLGCSSVSLPRLEILRLDGCGLLSEMPFTSCPALKQLHLTGLPGLVEIGDEFPSISMMVISHCGKLEKLRLPRSILYLSLKGLPSLVEVGCGAGLPSSLVIMEITDCGKLDYNILSSSQLKRLHLEALPSLAEIPTASKLWDLKIINCKRLVEFGPEAEFPSLKVLVIAKCEKLRILHPIRSLCKLSLNKLPALVQIGAAFPSLCELQISECERLAGLPSLPSLQDLTLELEALLSWEIVTFLRLESLTISTLGHKLPAIDQPLSHLKLTLEEFAHEKEIQLQLLGIEQCERLARLPAGQLRRLNLRQLPSLIEICSLPSTLEHLTISECGSLQTVPSASGVKVLQLMTLPSLLKIGPEYPSLTRLKIFECERLASVPSAPDLKVLQLMTLPSLLKIGPQYPSLTYLKISKCERLASVPSAPGLKTLELISLPSLVEIGPQYSSLTHLMISKCKRLEQVPSAPQLKRLLKYST